jgi:putative addiction module component (TIGR02574 family)
MTSTCEKLYEDAMHLSNEERAELAERLLASLQDVPSQLHTAWRDELRRRLNQVDSGEVTPISWDEVKRAAWEAVDRREAGPHG